MTRIDTTDGAQGLGRPLLGLRQRPGRLTLLVFRLPLPLYRAGWGWLFLGHTFLVLTHVGRKTGRPHATAAMVLAEDKGTGEAVICSVWGPRADWIRNLHAHPALLVQIGRTTFVPQHRFLTDQEAFTVAGEFRRRHPWRVRLISRVLGVDLRSEAGIRDFSAVVHQNEGGPTQMLPPKVTADYPNHGDSGLAAGLAGLWLLGTAGAITAVVRRKPTSST